ncbi:MAG: type I restriction endonuclease subunit M, partial [Chlorobium sp.]
RQTLFTDNRPGYLDLAIPKGSIRSTIYNHPEFVTFIESMNSLFAKWQESAALRLKNLQPAFHPKALIQELSEGLLTHYTGKPLIDNYHVYQHLMDYWTETMQDDSYLIAADGWRAETSRLLVKNSKGKEVDKGWACDLVLRQFVIARYFAEEQEAITRLEAELESLTARITELEEEHGGEEGVFSGLDKVNRASVTARLKEIKGERESKDEADLLREWLQLSGDEADLKRSHKEAEANLDQLAYAEYPSLSEEEVKTLVVDDKWLATIAAAIHGEMDRISQTLTRRVKELAERYETPLPEVNSKVAELEAKVNAHLQRMGIKL